MVWCRRHGWEKEIIPATDVFRDGEVWGWRCPTCGRSRIEERFSRGSAEQSLAAHVKDKHAGTVPFRLHGTPPGARVADHTLSD
jgi:hypothetical protein